VWIVGMILNLALPIVADPTLYGIPPMAYRWAVLTNGVILGLAGLFGMSPLRTSPGYTPPKEDPK
jgi:predicted metal-binding membrane protein